jgi:hypothetical protein
MWAASALRALAVCMVFAVIASDIADTAGRVAKLRRFIQFKTPKGSRRASSALR